MQYIFRLKNEHRLSLVWCIAYFVLLEQLFTHCINLNHASTELDEVDSLVAPYRKLLPAGATIYAWGHFNDDMDFNRVCYQANYFMAPMVISKDSSASDTGLFVQPRQTRDSVPINAAYILCESNTEHYRSVLYVKTKH